MKNSNENARNRIMKALWQEPRNASELEARNKRIRATAEILRKHGDISGAQHLLDAYGLNIDEQV